MGNLRVVIAEDDYQIRQQMIKILLDCGCDVLADFPDGGALTEWLLSNPRPDVIFTDNEMPVKTGIDVANEVRHIPIVLVTAYLNDDQEKQVLKSGSIIGVSYKPSSKQTIMPFLKDIRKQQEICCLTDSL